MLQQILAVLSCKPNKVIFKVSSRSQSNIFPNMESIKGNSSSQELWMNDTKPFAIEIQFSNFIFVHLQWDTLNLCMHFLVKTVQ